MVERCSNKTPTLGLMLARGPHDFLKTRMEIVLRRLPPSKWHSSAIRQIGTE
jgi:hypothetical protein